MRKCDLERPESEAGLKSAQFNDLPGTVVGPIANNRYPVEVSTDGKTAKLLVKVENIKVRKLDFDDADG